jgi:hypothetical protein
MNGHVLETLGRMEKVCCKRFAGALSFFCYFVNFTEQIHSRLFSSRLACFTRCTQVTPAEVDAVTCAFVSYPQHDRTFFSYAFPIEFTMQGCAEWIQSALSSAVLVARLFLHVVHPCDP